MTRGAWIGVVVGTTAVIGAGVGLTRWLLRESAATRPPPPAVHVQASYAQIRKGHGHELHVDQEGIECAACHDVEQGFRNPGSEPCRECHATQAAIVHAMPRAAPQGAEPITDCGACHSFGAEPQDQSWQCMRCHELAQNELHAVQVHAGEPCNRCHEPHGDDPVRPAACESCHADAANTHPALVRAHAGAGAGAGGGSADNCMTCHDGHAPAIVAVQRCKQCHDKPHALLQGHAECSSCHVPHAFEGSAAVDCKSCHSTVRVLASGKTAAHDECKACHSPHDVASASDAACRGCHTEITAQHPPTPAGATCIGCHSPHPTSQVLASAHGGAQACSHCHGAAHDRAFHDGRAECVACHRPHAFSEVEQAQACAACHQKQTALVATTPGHERCAGCHEGHPHAERLPAVSCRECHGKQSVDPGHEPCTSCHEPHGGEPLAIGQSCVRCHAAEHRGLNKGHGKCTTCHAPHDSTRAPGASCELCHAKQAAAPHGDLASGCVSCHAVHGAIEQRKPPPCQSCHERPALPGLHTVAEHGDCARCHTGAHVEPPWSTRAICVGCHAAEKNHQPEAKVCQGCHVFRR